MSPSTLSCAVLGGERRAGPAMNPARRSHRFRWCYGRQIVTVSPPLSVSLVGSERERATSPRHSDPQLLGPALPNAVRRHLKAVLNDAKSSSLDVREACSRMLEAGREAIRLGPYRERPLVERIPLCLRSSGWANSPTASSLAGSGISKRRPPAHDGHRGPVLRCSGACRLYSTGLACRGDLFARL